MPHMIRITRLLRQALIWTMAVWACTSALGQTTNVAFAPPYVVFLGTDGKPLANGMVQTFAAGTTNALGTFASANAASPQSANLTLNGGGGAQIFLGSQCYKFVVRNSAGVLQWTSDNLCATNLGSVTKIVSSNCASSLVATSGFVQMCNGDLISWRNIANSANIGFAQAGIATTATGNLADVLQYGTLSTGGLQAQRYLDFSSAPAQSGVLATGNNVCAVASRNAAGNGDVCAVQVNASNLVSLNGVGGIAPIKIAGNSGLPSNTTDGLWIGGGFGSPHLGRLYCGDGTGWQCEFAKRNGSSDTVLITITDQGELELKSFTFSSLPSSPNGTIVYCSDCNSTCSAGSSTGRTCFRENGAWTH